MAGTVPAQPQQQAHHSQAEQQGDASVQQLQQQQVALQRQLQELQQLVLQQQARQMAQRLQQHSSNIVQAMGHVDPVAGIWQPYITSVPALNAVMGAENNSALLPAAGSNQAAGLLAVLHDRESRLVEEVANAVVARLSSAAAGMTAATNTGAGVGAAVDTQETIGLLQEFSLAARAQVAAQPSQSSKQKVKEQIGFPNLSSHSTIENLAEWYYVTNHKNTGQTPQQLEAAGADNSYEWRGGPRHRFQRWNEYEQLLKAIEEMRLKLTEEARSRSSHPHRVVLVDAVSAARQLDVQRQRLGLSLCEFREFTLRRGKGYTKGKAKEAELEGGGGSEGRTEPELEGCAEAEGGNGSEA